jgi:hypothetical protein
VMLDLVLTCLPISVPIFVPNICLTSINVIYL